MLRRSSLRRTPSEWGWRGVLAVLAAILGYVSVSQSLGFVLRSSDPLLAHALAPWDGRVTALAARAMFKPDVNPTGRASGSRLARLALNQDATAIPAALVLGLNAQVTGNSTQADQLLAYASKLSRRELQTQIWAIETAVARNDIPSALRNYDIALRTSRAAPDLLFPVLAAAITEAPVRTALVKTLLSKPAWGAAFVNFASANSDPHAAVSLFQDMAKAGLSVSGESQAHVINSLTNRGRIADAWHYFQSVRSGATRQSSRDPNFSANLAFPTPFDWTLASDPDISVAILRGDHGGVVDFSVPSGRSGPLIHQMQVLVPGQYRLSGHGESIGQEGITPIWLLSCIDGRELGRVEMPRSDESGANFSGRFTVPPECQTQVLTLVARPSNAGVNVTGQIDRVHLALVQ